MSKDPTHQKRDFFRFESTLAAFIMPLDGKNPSNAGLLEGFLSLANSPLLNEVASLQATWRACLRENLVSARAMSGAFRQMSLGIDNLAREALRQALDQFESLQSTVRELGEGGFALECDQPLATGTPVAALMHDGSATTSITVFGTVKHSNPVSSGYVVGVQLGDDTNLRRRWQSFVRERQVFENKEAKLSARQLT